MTPLEIKHKGIIKEFQKLLRSGKDYSTMYMYEEAGGKYYLQQRGAQEVIKTHYRENILTDQMVEFVKANTDRLKRNALIDRFSKEFKICKRESNYLLWFCRAAIRRIKN